MPARSLAACAALSTLTLMACLTAGCGAPEHAAGMPDSSHSTTITPSSRAAAPPAVAPPGGAGAAAEPDSTVGPPDFDEHAKQTKLALDAYERKDFAAFLQHASAAARAAPDSPRALYNLACAHALNGDAAAATEALGRLADKRVHFDLTADTDFDRVRGTPEFTAIVERMKALQAPIGSSTKALTLAEKDLIPEGVAHDPATDTYFVSSVHRRKIVRVAAGKASDLVKEGEHGLMAVLGLAFDGARGSLYACSTAVPEMKGFRDEDRGKAGLFELDARTGKPRRKVLLAEADKAHNLNDLVVDSKGEVLVSDPAAGTILSLAPGAASFAVFLAAGRIAGPQGLALSQDEQTLYVAAYARGIARVDRATREVVYLAAPPDGTLAGIDGLRMYSGDLIAIQNGVRPHRVVRLALAADGRGVRSATVLEMNNPVFDEPTLGVVTGKDFVYVANSQWGSFDKGGVIWPVDRLKEPVLLRLRLAD